MSAPPPPGPPPEMKSAKRIYPKSDGLGKINLKKVDEKEKRYKTLYDMIVGSEKKQKKHPEHPRSQAGNMKCYMCKSEETDITLQELVDFGCSHFLCTLCVSKHCEDFVIKNRRSFITVPCKFEGCKMFCPVPVVEKYLSEEGRKFVKHIKSTTFPTNLPDDPCPPNFTFPLSSFGYRFDENQVLRHSQTGDPFYYVNERFYDAVGESVARFVQDLLVQKYGLIEHFCDPKRYNNIFRSDLKRDKLMIIIPGSGKVQPGQWSRRLCTSDSLQFGSSLDYVELALKEEYDVILANTNTLKVRKEPMSAFDRFNWSDPSKVPVNRRELEVVENCENAVMHLLYIYNNFVKPCAHYKQYFVVAHSAGGLHTMDLLRKMNVMKNQEFFEKLTAIGFTDSIHRIAFNENRVVRDFVTANAVNWARSEEDLDHILKEKSEKNCLTLSAGHNVHEYTSSSCMHSLFKYFQKKGGE